MNTLVLFIFNRVDIHHSLRKQYYLILYFLKKNILKLIFIKDIIW